MYLHPEFFITSYVPLETTTAIGVRIRKVLGNSPPVWQDHPVPAAACCLWAALVLQSSGPSHRCHGRRYIRRHCQTLVPLRQADVLRCQKKQLARARRSNSLNLSREECRHSYGRVSRRSRQELWHASRPTEYPSWKPVIFGSWYTIISGSFVSVEWKPCPMNSPMVCGGVPTN